jgi:hypothetical protein
MNKVFIRPIYDEKKFNSIHPFIGAYQPSVSNYELINL